jgi:hypothetical protein
VRHFLIDNNEIERRGAGIDPGEGGIAVFDRG